MLQRNKFFWLVAIIGLILDQVTKYIVVLNFPNIGDTIPLVPDVFHFTYVINTGAAFGRFPGGVTWLRWLSLIVSLVLILFGLLAPKMLVLEQLAYGFVLAGAFGNGIDRFLFGYVVDFLDFRLINFPVFNLADTFINIGIFLLLILLFSPKKE
ncbi:MAG: lipoprotein signal peptidase [Gloeocapsa sp. DLM2.Bin57]|nr:MAG: lipoprotein signal peptidase [Gloeocapsa sp. DLM2.Bin57]